MFNQRHKHRDRYSDYPEQCKNLEHHSFEFVYGNDWEPYVIMGAIGLFYGAAAIYFYKQRNKVSFMTRSPMTVSISLFLLGLDSIFNTLIFSSVTIGNILHF